MQETQAWLGNHIAVNKLKIQGVRKESFWQSNVWKFTSESPHLSLEIPGLSYILAKEKNK